MLNPTGTDAASYGQGATGRSMCRDKVINLLVVAISLSI